MKKELTFVLSMLFGLLLFVYVINKAGIGNIIKAFEMISFYKYLLIFGLYFIIYLITLARWGMALKAIGYYIPFAKLLSLRLSEWAFGYITPFARLGGEPVMAYLFKKECDVRFRKGIFIIVMNKFMDFASAVLLSLAGIFFFVLAYSKYLPKKISFMYILAIVLLSILIYLFYFKITRKEGFFSMIISPLKDFLHSNIKNGIAIVEKELHNFFGRSKKKVIVMLSISLIIQFLMLVDYKILGLFLGVNLTLTQLLMVFAFAIFAFLIPTPGSLGSFEGSMALIFSLFGYGAGMGVAFALIIRSFELIFTGLGLLFLSYYGIKLRGQTFNSNI